MRPPLAIEAGTTARNAPLYAAGDRAARRLYRGAMSKTAHAFALAFALAATPALAAGDAFVPRLLKAIDDYMRAHDACLRRTIGEEPTGGRKAEEIASAAIRSCRTRDADVMAAARRVHGFPSVDNFMAGNEEKITAFAIRVAKAKIAARYPWQFW